MQLTSKASKRSSAQKKGTDRGPITEPRAASHPPPPTIGWWSAVLALPIIACALAAFIGSSLSTPLYAARAELLFQPQLPGDVSEQFRATQAVVLTGRTVLTPLSSAFATPPDELAERLTVTFPKGSAVMEIQFADLDPARALSVLNAMLDRYLALLDRTAANDQPRHQLLAPPYVLEDPIQPKPLQMGALGAAVGIAISLGLFALLQRRRQGA